MLFTTRYTDAAVNQLRTEGLVGSQVGTVFTELTLATLAGRRRLLP
ncbi:hypothetical protein MHW47_30220 [Streptomyces sp. OfavH-34-F]|nr:hypothetical protein [Streptomyces sp. OfavH-34-F]MCG7528703.1 hypothetical protein [Streptomyces sp. OfavH-34-F]